MRKVSQPRCKHASDATGPSVPNLGAPRRCALNLYPVVHTLGVCRTCEKNEARGKSVGAPTSTAKDACRHRSEKPTGSQTCVSCRGSVELKIFNCAVHGTATIATRVEKRGCCEGCQQREAPT